MRKFLASVAMLGMLASGCNGIPGFPVENSETISTNSNPTLNFIKDKEVGGFVSYSTIGYDPFKKTYVTSEADGVINFKALAGVPASSKTDRYHDGYFAFSPQGTDSLPVFSTVFKDAGEYEESAFKTINAAPEIGYLDPLPGERSYIEIKSGHAYFLRISSKDNSKFYGKMYIKSLSFTEVSYILSVQTSPGLREPLSGRD